MGLLAVACGDSSSPDVPPDPATVAPPIDRTVPTTVFQATRFLYQGEHPIQTGMSPAAIDPRRTAVLRGRVTAKDGTPLAGATITVLHHPELGQTLTRADGAFDLVGNGGEPLIVDISKDGFLTSQRTVDVPWQDYVQVPDLVLLSVSAMFDGVVSTMFGGCDDHVW
jgi:Carboxypeptidase regulatory-like domain